MNAVTKHSSVVHCSYTAMQSRHLCWSLPAQPYQGVLLQTDGDEILMTIHVQPAQAGWCFHKGRLFYLGRTGSKDGREYRSSTYTDSSALAGCFLHQKVVPF